MRKNSVELNTWADSPRAESESLRAEVLAVEERERQGVLGATHLFVAPGRMVPRGETPQESISCLNAWTSLSQSVLQKLPGDEATRCQQRVFIRDYEKETADYYGTCTAGGCAFCRWLRNERRTFIASYINSLGEWMEYRLSLERRTERKIKRLWKCLDRERLTYSQIQITRDRLYLIPTMDMVCNGRELIELVRSVGELEWRTSWA